MRHTILTIALCLLAMMQGHPGSAAAPKASDYDISTYAHPRLLLPACGIDEIRAKAESDDFLAFVHSSIIRRSGKMLGEPLVQEGIIDSSDMLHTSRTVLERVFFLSYSYLLTGDTAYAVRAKEEMLNVCSFASWNPAHYLDVAEMTAALAIGYDWLYGYLDQTSRDRISEAIYKNGIYTGFEDMNPNENETRWLHKKNNWNPVCNAGLSLGAIAAYEYDPTNAKRVLDRAVHLVRDVAIPEYGPDGIFPEGYTYWNYGTTYCLLLIDSLSGLLGTDFGISSSAGFHKSPEFILQMTTQDLSCWDFSDCTSQELGNNFPLFWFANHDDNPSLLWGERQKIEYMHKHGLDSRISGVRYLPCVMFWASKDPFNGTEAPTTRYFKGQGTTPLAIMRNHWEGEDEIFAGLKGGKCLTNHAHMDIGSFVMYRGGKHWIKDLGIQKYYPLTKHGINLGDRSQNSSRWDAFRLGKDAHNIMTFGDRKQLVEPTAAITSGGDCGDFIYAVTDLSEVDALSVKEHRRGIAIINDSYFIVRDEVTAGTERTPFRWAAVTAADVKITGRNSATLTIDGEKMRMKVEGKGIRMGTWPTTPRRFYDEPNPGTVMVGFTSSLKPGESASYTVTFLPEGVKEGPKVKPLEEWEKDEVKYIADKVAGWQMENFTDTVLHKAHWANGALYKGMMEWADQSGSKEIENWLLGIGESTSWGLLPRIYDADDLCIGQMYLNMYEKYKKPQMLDTVKNRVDYVMSHPDTAPLIRPNGKYYRNRWGWCDALFMAAPVYAELSKIERDDRYLDFCFSEFQVTADSLYNRDAHLFYRDLSLVKDKEPNGKQVYWGRGNGWVFAALSIMLEKVPASHQSYSYYKQMYLEMADAIIGCQDKSGAWHSGLYDPIAWSAPENSASGFFVYGLTWGLNHGTLNGAKYEKAAKAGWDSLKACVHPDGKLGYVQAIGHSPAKVTYDMTAVYGVGAFLLAATEMDRFLN